MHKGRKGGNFGLKMQALLHSHSSFTPSVPPKPQKPHQNHRNEHFYELSIVLMELRGGGVTTYKKYYEQQ